MLHIENDGPLIRSTNFWETDIARAGKVFISTNAGFLRIPLPDTLAGPLIEAAKETYLCILSRGPWPAAGLQDAVEIVFEDGSESPYCFHLSPESFDNLPGEPPAGDHWHLTLWEHRDGRPRLALQRLCLWRRVDSLPCLQPWGKPV